MITITTISSMSVKPRSEPGVFASAFLPSCPRLRAFVVWVSTHTTGGAVWTEVHTTPCAPRGNPLADAPRRLVRSAAPGVRRDAEAMPARPHAEPANEGQCEFPRGCLRICMTGSLGTRKGRRGRRGGKGQKGQKGHRWPQGRQSRGPFDPFDFCDPFDAPLYDSLLSNSISGMNRAITMNPTIRPKTTTMIGSRMLIRPSTSTATSSSYTSATL